MFGHTLELALTTTLFISIGIQIMVLNTTQTYSTWQGRCFLQMNNSMRATTQQKLPYIMLKNLHELEIVITIFIYNPQCLAMERRTG
jgi:hypothetical protein